MPRRKADNHALATFKNKRVYETGFQEGYRMSRDKFKGEVKSALTNDPGMSLATFATSLEQAQNPD